MKVLFSSRIRWFDTLRLEDIDLVGGKNASLGELSHSFRKEAVLIPRGFAITTDVYSEFLKVNQISGLITDLFSSFDSPDLEKVQSVGSRIRSAIQSGKFGEQIRGEILKAYHELSQIREGRLDVAVRSSSTAEDLPEASFAGQQDTFLNVEGDDALLDSIRRCFASLYSDRAITYRNERRIPQTSVRLSVGVQEMVRSDLAVSGVLFTLDPETGFRDLVVLNSSYGLGEAVVRGAVNPDEYWVYKPLIEEGLVPILKRDIGTKQVKVIYDADQLTKTVEVEVPLEEQKQRTLTDGEVLDLARASALIERHFSSRREHPTPMDIEWAKDGMSGKLYVVQARPETVQSARGRQGNPSEMRYFIEESGPIIARGRSVGAEIRTGKARIISSVKELHQLRENEILVTSKTDPDWEPVMRLASAIVTNQGGRTCHAAIMARELGIPAVVGTGNGTGTIPGGEVITVSSAEGDTGLVYLGASRFRTESTSGGPVAETKTKIMINLGRSEDAIRYSFLTASGVGLARMEFMITSGIGIHPMALARFDQVNEPETREKILALIPAHEEPREYFVRRLSEQIGVMAAAFFPRPVILRMSDFKSNEYGNLLGGTHFESSEENPAIGFRGAFRYSHERYRDGFHLECEAVRRVRLEMGLTNLEVMIPFCRTIQDAKNALNELESAGIRRGESGLKVWMMCELPSNVVLAKDFAALFDGFSIGSNDLTQLVLGVDRDSEVLSSVFNENDPAVIEMIRTVIRSGKQAGIPVGICGQAPSDDPGFVEFLVREGIDSISLSPDSVSKVRTWVERAEKGRR